VARNLTVTAADGAKLLLDHYTPRARRFAGRAGRGVDPDSLRPQGNRLDREPVRQGRCTRGRRGGAWYRWLGRGHSTASRSPHGDGAAVVAWLRAQPWFGGTIVTWGLSALGYASWALAGLDVPEWRLAILQDAQSELRDAVIYPGGAFAGKTMPRLRARRAVAGPASEGRRWRARCWPRCAAPGGSRRCWPGCRWAPPTNAWSGIGSTTSSSGSPTSTTTSSGNGSTCAATPPACRAWCTWPAAGTTCACHRC